MIITDRKWYDYIDELVIKFQNGDSESGALLVSFFEPYIIKFGRLMQEGFVNLKDRDTRRFISLFINDNLVRKGLIKARQSSSVRNEAYKAATLIKQICSNMTQDDVDQELKVIFFTLAKRWRKNSKRANFCGYVYNSFRYELHRSLVNLTGDPLSYQVDNMIRYNDGESEGETHEYVDQDDLLVFITESELDHSWIRGTNCSSKFNALTPLQRFILREHYVNGLSDQKIADMVGMHLNTIYTNRKKAIQKLEPYEDN